MSKFISRAVSILIILQLIVLCPSFAYSTVPWEKNEIENHTLKLTVGKDRDIYFLFSTNGIGIYLHESPPGYYGSLFFWDIDSAGYLVGKAEYPVNKDHRIVLKKISSDGDTVKVFLDNTPYLGTKIKHPSTVPWEEIKEKQGFNLVRYINGKKDSKSKVEVFTFARNGSAQCPSGSNDDSKNVPLAACAGSWRIDSSGTLIFSTGGSDFIMRKINSRTDSLEVLFNGEPRVYKLNISKFDERYLSYILLVMVLGVVGIVWAIVRWWKNRARSNIKDEDLKKAGEA